MDETRTGRLPPAQWLQYFAKAEMRTKELAGAPSAKGKSILVGNFLSPNVGRVVPIEVKGRSGHAVLRVQSGRGKSRLYYFEVVWDTPGEDSPLLPVAKPAHMPAEETNQTRASSVTPPTTGKPTKAVPKASTTRDSDGPQRGAMPATTTPKGPTAGNGEEW